MKYLALSVALIFTTVFGAMSQDVSKKMNEYMSAVNELGTFSGNVLVIKNGRPVFEKSYGKASLELNVANNKEYAFRSGTLTQQFVAYAALKMHATGKISIENPISFYLPEYRKDIGQKVKIMDLLMHTSGLPDFIANPDYLGDKSCYPMSKSEFIKKFCSETPSFDPGSKSAVSSTNYYLLGVILERQTGNSLAEVLQQYVFGPLGMVGAGVESSGALAKGLVTGYNRDEDGNMQQAGYINLALVGGAGAVYLTSADWQKWGAANMRETEESKKMQSLTSSSKSVAPLGWTVDEAYGKKRKGGIGIMKGFLSSIDLFVEEDLAIYIMSNYSFAPVNRMRLDLAAIALGEKYTLPGQAPTAISLSAAELKPFEGDYIIEGNPMQFVIKLKGDKLYVGQNLNEMDEMIPIGKEEFYMKSKPDSRFKFAKSGSNVTGFTLYLSDNVIPFKKK